LGVFWGWNPDFCFFFFPLWAKLFSPPGLFPFYREVYVYFSFFFSFPRLFTAELALSLFFPTLSRWCPPLPPPTLSLRPTPPSDFPYVILTVKLMDFSGPQLTPPRSGIPFHARTPPSSFFFFKCPPVCLTLLILRRPPSLPCSALFLA